MVDIKLIIVLLILNQNKFNRLVHQVYQRHNELFHQHKHRQSVFPQTCYFWFNQ